VLTRILIVEKIMNKCNPKLAEFFDGIFKIPFPLLGQFRAYQNEKV
jgi:hypothetical protein